MDIKNNFMHLPVFFAASMYVQQEKIAIEHSQKGRGDGKEEEHNFIINIKPTKLNKIKK